MNNPSLMPGGLFLIKPSTTILRFIRRDSILLVDFFSLPRYRPPYERCQSNSPF